MPPAPLPDRTDVLVVGAGLAGASLALALQESREVTVLDAGQPASGASGAAAGIVNPFMGQKAKPSWRHDEALDALRGLLDAAGAPALFRHVGVIRPATSAKQADGFRDRAATHADLAWLGPEAAAERWPSVAAPDGALWVARGGHVRIPALVRAALDASGAAVRLGVALRAWRRSGAATVAITDHGEIQCRALILALGDGARHVPALAALPLHRVKGQTVRLTRPEAVAPDHPAVAGHGYVVPDADAVTVGATFEHDVAHTEADPALDAGLRAQASRLVPSLAEAAVLGRRAGVRLTVPASVSPGRLPLAGALPGEPGVWVLTGLGAKGLLTAPLLARRLAEALNGGAPMPPEVDPALVLGGRVWREC